jgi:hypothetical protein
MNNALTVAALLLDFNQAIDLAIFDAGRGSDRWLRELAAMGAERATNYPSHRQGFLAATKRAHAALRGLAKASRQGAARSAA